MVFLAANGGRPASSWPDYRAANRLIDRDVELLDVVVVAALLDRAAVIERADQRACACNLTATLHDHCARFARCQLAAGAIYLGVDRGAMADRGAGKARTRDDLTGLVQRFGKEDGKFDVGADIAAVLDDQLVGATQSGLKVAWPTQANEAQIGALTASVVLQDVSVGALAGPRNCGDLLVHGGATLGLKTGRGRRVTGPRLACCLADRQGRRPRLLFHPA